MIVKYTRYKIRAEHRTAFADAYKKAAEPLKASEHCLAYALAQCAEDPDDYILRIECASEEGNLRSQQPGVYFPFALVRPYANGH